MKIEKSYKIKYEKDGKEVWAWLTPGADLTPYEPILEKIQVIVLKAEEGMTLMKDGIDVGEAVFLNSEEEKDLYIEVEKKEDPEPIPPQSN